MAVCRVPNPNDEGITMTNDLELTVESIIEAITAEKEEYLDEVKTTDKHVMYLVGQLKAYSHMLYILKQEAKINA